MLMVRRVIAGDVNVHVPIIKQPSRGAVTTSSLSRGAVGAGCTLFITGRSGNAP